MLQGRTRDALRFYKSPRFYDFSYVERSVYRRLLCLQVFVGSVAEGAVFAVFTGTEKNLAILFCCVLDRCELRSFVGSVTKGLLAALTTRAPKIAFSLFHFYRHRCGCGYGRFCHWVFLLFDLVLNRVRKLASVYLVLLCAQRRPEVSTNGIGLF